MIRPSPQEPARVSPAQPETSPRQLVGTGSQVWCTVCDSWTDAPCALSICPGRALSLRPDEEAA